MEIIIKMTIDHIGGNLRVLRGRITIPDSIGGSVRSPWTCPVWSRTVSIQAKYLTSIVIMMRRTERSVCLVCPQSSHSPGLIFPSSSILSHSPRLHPPSPRSTSAVPEVSTIGSISKTADGWPLTGNSPFLSSPPPFVRRHLTYQPYTILPTLLPSPSYFTVWPVLSPASLQSRFIVYYCPRRSFPVFPTPATIQGPPDLHIALSLTRQCCRGASSSERMLPLHSQDFIPPEARYMPLQGQRSCLNGFCQL